MAPGDSQHRRRLVFVGLAVGVATLLSLIASLLMDASPAKPRPQPPPQIYVAEVTLNEPYAGADPGKALITYNFVVYYVATTNKAKYQALLDLDGIGGVWAVIPVSGVPAEWNVPCSRGSDTTVWSTEAPGYKQAARAYCDETFGPGIAEYASAAPPGCTRTWKQVAAPFPTSDRTSAVSIAALEPSDLWMAQAHQDSSGTGSRASHFDGTTWTALPTPDGGRQQFVIKGLVVLAWNDIWAVGFTPGPQSLIEHYDGLRWNVVLGPWLDSTSSSLNAIARVPGRNELWAVGQFTIGSTTRTLTEHYDGLGWTVVPSPTVGTFSNLLGVSADASGGAWAVGSHADGKTPESLIEHYDGKRWSVMASFNVGWPSDANPLNGVVALSPTDVWAVGTSMALDGNTAYTHIEHYDGTGWSLVQSPDPGLSALYGVVATSAKDVWAVGSYEHVDADYTHTLVEHFDGSNWAVVPTPYIEKANASFSGVAIIPNTRQLWAVGATNDSSAKKAATYSRPLIESLTWNC